MAKTFNPKLVSVSFAGYQLSGFGDTFISAERNTDAFTLVKGADGETSRVASADRSGKVTITLKQSSLSNDILSGLAALDELSGLGTGSLLIKDIAGTTLLEAQEAWISKLPSVTMGKEGSEREWVIECGELLMLVGGNV